MQQRFWITTTHGMRGYFAVMMVEDEDGLDVQQSGIGSYKTQAEAECEGRDWAKAEELEFTN